MLVNNEILEHVKMYIGSSKYRKATDLVSQRKVVIVSVDYIDDINFHIKTKIMESNETFNCEIQIDDNNFITRKCSCTSYQESGSYCLHVAATLLELNRHEEYIKEANENIKNEEKDYSYGSIKKVSKDMKYKESHQLLKLFAPESYNRHTEKSLIGEVKIVPELEYNMHQNQFCAFFKIGKDVFYKISDIERFYECMIGKENFEYGKSLKFVHTIEKFNDRSQKLVKLIMEYGRMLHIINNNNDLTYRYGAVHKDNLELAGAILDSFFDIMQGEKVEVKGIRGVEKFEISDSKPPIRFKIEKHNANEYKLVGSFSKYNRIITGEEYTYFIDEGVVYRCNTENYNDLFKVVAMLDEMPNKEIMFEKTNLPSLFSLIIPRVKENFDFSNINGTELEYYMPAPLAVKVFLDTNHSNDIEADVKFIYNDKEFNPFNDVEGKDITRNLKEEADVIDIFHDTGFIINDKNKIVLHNEENIYNFLTEDILMYMKKFEVLASENFNKKQIIKPKISKAQVRMDNNLLELNFDTLGYTSSELRAILEGYTEKKKYVRLKNGAFLSLEENEELEFISDIFRSNIREIKKYQYNKR